MSTLDRPEPRVIPPLVAGQRLDQPTFHERYEAMPPGTWAELVDGVVYMPSPLRGDHGQTTRTISCWLGNYQSLTPGTWGGDNTTTKLGHSSEPQPDCTLRIFEQAGGQSRIDDEGYLAGAPELIVEVARSSRSFDLGPKKHDYERAGVREYIVVALGPDRVHWFVLRDGRFHDLLPGADGIFRSEVFPGLWLDPDALFADDVRGVLATLERGLATPEHAAFVARLAAANPGRPPA